MIIAVDAGCLSVNDERLKTGVYYFAKNLLENLLELDKKNTYILYSPAKIFHPMIEKYGTNVQNKVLKPHIFWMSIRLSIEFLLNKPDVYIGLSQALPLYHPGKNIVFIHDIAYEFFQEYFAKSYKRISKITKYALSHAEKIVSVSDKTKRDLNSYYGIKEDKIMIIHHGLEAIFYPRGRDEIKNIRKKYNITYPYFLYVGSMKPIKNVPRIIEAFDKFSMKSKNKFQLVLVGSNYWWDKRIDNVKSKLNIKDKIIYPGFVQRSDLPALYSGARGFISPSLYEGFGLPAVEALGCGAPVVVSRSGSFPEIIQNVGIYVDSNDSKDIAKGMEKVLKIDRNKLKLEAKVLLGTYSWRQSAEKLLKEISTL